MPDKIKKIVALEILDSRGKPTVQATVELNNGLQATAAVPSGASTGRFEACELRDGDPQRYAGQGVLKAVNNVNTILNKELNGLRTVEQGQIDKLMMEIDGTHNKSRLGANAILGVSLAVAKAAALSLRLPLYKYLRQLYNPELKDFQLPKPLVNIVNGGKHASTNLDIQEFWIVPHRASTFAERLRQASEIFQNLGDLLAGLGMDTDLGNEGGYAPNFISHRQVLDLLTQAVAGSSAQLSEDVFLGLDAGSSVFYDEQSQLYKLSLENKSFSADEMMEYYVDLMEVYPLRFLEDPLAEEDWDNWQRFSRDHFVEANHVKLIGDDLFVTNKKRLARGVALGVANAILIKPNQIGTLTETLETIKLAQDNHYEIAVSHRSGETTDTSIADLAVAVNAQYIKTGSTARGERIAKYNRLLNIEKELLNFL